MSTIFEEHLIACTDTINNVLSSPAVDEEERDFVVANYCDRLREVIGKDDDFGKCERAIFKSAFKYNDNQITCLANKSDISSSECAKGLKHCDREKELRAIISKKNWLISDFSEIDLDNCESVFSKRAESISITDNLVELDKKVDEAINYAKSTLSILGCESASKLLVDLGSAIRYCREKGLPVPRIKYANITKTASDIQKIRQEAESRGQLCNSIVDLDRQISDLLSSKPQTVQTCNDIVSLCRRITEFKQQCSSNGWQLPQVNNKRVDLIEIQYNHYRVMNNVDQAINAFNDADATDKQYSELYENCDIQQRNIESCESNKWPIPMLSIPKPLIYAEYIREKRIKRENKNKRRIKLVAIASAIALLIVFISVVTIVNRAGKVRLPFSESEALGRNYKSLIEDLEEAGFTNTKRVETKAGWKKGGTVISVTVNDTEHYRQRYYYPDTEIVIEYSSKDRIDVSDIVNNYNGQYYQTIEKKLRIAGINNIKLIKKTTYTKEQDNQLFDIMIGGESYKKGSCYIDKDAIVSIHYYTWKIQIGISGEDAIKNYEKKNDYKKLVSYLKDKGYTNIKLLRANDLTTGWIDSEGSIKNVSIVGKNDFEKSDDFLPTDEITIIVHTFKNRGCEDIIEVAN